MAEASPGRALPPSAREAPDTSGIQKLAEDLHACVAIKDRMYRFFTYKACFVASEAIDWLIGAGRAAGRDEAVQLGRLLQASGYIHHVVDDHDFRDTFLYFRFFCDELERLPDGRYMGVLPLRALTSAKRPTVTVPTGPDSRLAVGSPTAAPPLPGASPAGPGTQPGGSLRSLSGSASTGAESMTNSLSAAGIDLGGAPARGASPGPRVPLASMDALRAALMPLAVRLRARLDTRDRVFRLRTYRCSFVGSQCVDLLVRWGLVPSRVMAVALGRQLLAARFIHHVCDDHDFRDGSLFYRFFADEDDEAQADRFFAAPTLDLPTFARPSPRVPRLVRAPRSGGTDLPSWRVPSHVSCNSPITGLAISDALQWAVGTDDPLATAWCLGVMRRRARFLALSRPGTRKQIQRSAAARAASLPAASRRADPSTTPDYLWQPFPAEDPWEEIKTGDAGSGAERTRVWRLGGERVHQVYRAETIVDASLGDARLCIASLPNRAVWDTASEEPRVVGRVKADRRALEAATWEQPGSSERDIDAAGVRAARSETSSSSAVSSTAPPATVASMGVDTASSSSRAESEADGLGPLVTLPVPRRAGRTGAPSGPASRSAERAEARQTAVRDHARLVRLIGASEVLRILEGAVGYSTQAGPGGGAAAAAAGWGTGGGSDRGRAGSETSGVSVDRDDGAGSGGAGSGRTPDVTSPGPALAADVAGRTGREDEPLLHETMGRVLRRLFGSGAPATAPAPAAESPPREVAASHARRAAASAAAPSPSRGGRPPVVGAGAGRAESAAPGLRHHPAVPLCLESDAAGAGGDGSPEDADDDTGSQEAKSVESGPAAVGSDLRRPPVRPRLASEAAAAAASGAGGGGGVVLGRDLSVSGRDSSTASSSRSSAAGASSWGMGEGRDDDEIVLTALAGGRAGRSAAVAPDTGGFGMDTDGEDDEAAPGAAGADSRRRLERYASARRRCFPRIVRRGMRALSVFVAARDAVTIQDAHAGAVLVGDDDRALAGPPGRASSGNRAASGSSVRSDTSSLGAAPPRLPDAATPFFVHLEVSVQHRSHRKPESSRDVRAEVVLECWSFFDVSGGGVGSDQAGGPRTLVVLTTCLFPGALPIWMSRTVLDAQTIGPVERLRGALRMLSMARKRKGARPATGGSGAPAAPPAPVSREASLADTDGAPRSVPGTDAHMAERRTASNAWANPFHASSPGMGSALASPGSRSDLGRSSAQSSAGQTGVASTAGRRAAAEVLARFAEATTSSESDLGSDSGSDEEHRRRRGDEDDEDDEAEAEAEASLPGRTGLGGKRRSRAARSLVSSLRSDSRGQASPFPPAAAEAAAAAGAAPAAPVLPTAAAPAAPARAPRLTDFKVLAVLGRGGYGKVMQVLHKPSGAVLAMKVLRKSALVRRGQVARTLNERDILASASHPFVVGMRCAMQTSRKLYLCMDFVPGGDFFTLLSRRGAVPERRARVYVAELVLALAYLHSRGVVYRDLKPENVLLDADGHIALTDFGLSRLPVRRTASALPLGICKGKGSDREPAPTPDPSPDDPEAVAAAALVAGLAPGLVTRSVGPLDPSYSFCGTEQYMAPEVLLQSGHACTADWWSLGVFVSELLTGQHPFRGDSHYNTLRNIVHPSVRPATLGLVSAEAASLLDGLLTRDPRARLGSPDGGGALAVTQHPWFAGLDWHAIYRREVAPGYRPPTASAADTSLFDPEFTRENPVDSVASSVGDGLAYERRRMLAPMEGDDDDDDVTAAGADETVTTPPPDTPEAGQAAGDGDEAAGGKPLWYFPRWDVALE